MSSLALVDFAFGLVIGLIIGAKLMKVAAMKDAKEYIEAQSVRREVPRGQ